VGSTTDAGRKFDGKSRTAVELINGTKADKEQRGCERKDLPGTERTRLSGYEHPLMIAIT
jgi:hypothetical protein